MRSLLLRLAFLSRMREASAAAAVAAAVLLGPAGSAVLPAGEAPMAGTEAAASEASRSVAEGMAAVTALSAGPVMWKG